MENEIDISQKVDEVKNTVSEFKEKVTELINDLHVDTNHWTFSVDCDKDQMVVDLSAKLILKKKTED